MRIGRVGFARSLTAMLLAAFASGACAGSWCETPEPAPENRRLFRFNHFSVLMDASSD